MALMEQVAAQYQQQLDKHRCNLARFLSGDFSRDGGWIVELRRRIAELESILTSGLVA